MSWPNPLDRDEDGIPDSCEAKEGRQRPGDASQDGSLDLSDAIWLLEYLFLGAGPALPCEGGTAAGPGPGNLGLLDVNGDGGIDISDPSNPVEAGHYFYRILEDTISGGLTSVTYDIAFGPTGYLYVTDNVSGIRVLKYTGQGNSGK